MNDQQPTNTPQAAQPATNKLSLKARALRAVFSWFGHMSPAGRARAGRILGWLAMRLVRPRVRVARRNIELCFPELDHDAREDLLRQHFHALAQSVVDRGVLWFRDADTVCDLVELRGEERFMSLYNAGQSFIFLAPHFIALDAAATRITVVLPSAATMYSPQSDPDVDALVRDGRKRFHEVHLVSRRDGIRGVVRHIRAGRPVYYLPDMDFGRKGSIFTPFFGIPAATLTATAQLARSFNLPVLPVLSTWNPDTGRYVVDILPPMDNFPGDDSLEDATARLNQELESWVRRCPSQYYWVHRRFKTRPEGEAKLY